MSWRLARTRIASLEVRLGLWLMRHPLAVPIAIALVFATADALARPGAGQSYSSGSSSRSSGSSSGSRSSGSRSSGGSHSSGGGGGIGDFFADLLISLLLEILEVVIIELCKLLFALTVQHPKVMIPIWIALIVVPLIWWHTTRWLRERGWTTAKDSPDVDRLAAWRWAREWDKDAPLALTVPTSHADSSLPGGSNAEVRALMARHDKQFSSLRFLDFVAAFFEAAQTSRGQEMPASLARWVLPAAREVLVTRSSGVRDVAIGSIRFAGSPTDMQGEAALTVQIDALLSEVKAGGKATTVFTSEVWRFRRKASLSSSEAAMQLEAPEGDDTGWTLSSVAVNVQQPGPRLLDREERPATVTRRTMCDDMADGGWAYVQRRDPGVTDASFLERITQVFEALQEALRTRDLSPLDAMLGPVARSQVRYRVRALAALGQREVSEDAKLRRVELVQVLAEGGLDAVTVRVFVNALEYVIDADSGEVKMGSETERRQSSEYWTFARPADGSREWVLARIESDRDFALS